MRVLIDFRPALGETTGVARYVRCLVSSLRDVDPSGDYVLFSSSLKDRLRDKIPATAAGFAVVDRRIPVRVLNLLWHNTRWPPAEVLAGRIDITHSPTPLPVPSRSARTVITVHDVHFLLHPEDTRAEIRRDYTRLAVRAMESADAVIVPSRATADEISRTCGISGSKIHTIHHGVESIFTDRTPEPDENAILRRLLGFDAPFFLFVGRDEPRKNLPRTASAFRMVLDRSGLDLHFVVAGPRGWDRAALADIVDRRGMRDRFHFLGWTGAADLARLYRTAAALIYASKREGFGFPILEAMACGCPVVTSSVSSMPEVAGDAATYCDPSDEESIARAMLDVLEHPEEARRRISTGKLRAGAFTWKNAARSTVDVYRSLLY